MRLIFADIFLKICYDWGVASELSVDMEISYERALRHDRR